jgi:hypothetical protein
LRKAACKRDIWNPCDINLFVSRLPWTKNWSYGEQALANKQSIFKIWILASQHSDVLLTDLCIWRMARYSRTITLLKFSSFTYICSIIKGRTLFIAVFSTAWQLASRSIWGSCNYLISPDVVIFILMECISNSLPFHPKIGTDQWDWRANY